MTGEEIIDCIDRLNYKRGNDRADGTVLIAHDAMPGVPGMPAVFYVLPKENAMFITAEFPFPIPQEAEPRVRAFIEDVNGTLAAGKLELTPYDYGFGELSYQLRYRVGFNTDGNISLFGCIVLDQATKQISELFARLAGPVMKLVYNKKPTSGEKKHACMTLESLKGLMPELPFHTERTIYN